MSKERKESTYLWTADRMRFFHQVSDKVFYLAFMMSAVQAGDDIIDKSRYI